MAATTTHLTAGRPTPPGHDLLHVFGPAAVHRPSISSPETTKASVFKTKRKTTPLLNGLTCIDYALSEFDPPAATYFFS